MSQVIKIKGGSGAPPKLSERELGYNKTDKALYIGTSGGNVKLCDADLTKEYVDALIASINARLDALENQ